MGNYLCRLGDVKEVGLTDPGKFVVKDIKGRDWYCRESSTTEANTSFSDPVWEMMKVQQRAHQQGNSQEGSQIVILMCERDRLPYQLGAK
jgi:hypothetical protein